MGTVNPADHTGLVARFAKRYANRGMDYEDLFQEGVFGLIRAAQKFDPTRGVPFSSYASYWIAAFIRRAFIEKTRLIRLPHRAFETGVKLPTPMSLDAPLGEDGATYHDVIGDDGPRPDELAADNELRRILSRAVAKLNHQERFVIRHRFVEDMTLEQVGELLGLTRERVRQIEAQALAELKPYLERRLS